MKKSVLILLTMAFISLSCALQAQRKYAVLITGDYTGANVPAGDLWNDGNPPGTTEWGEFWYDTYLMWEMLVNEKGYADGNVFVLFANGNDYNIAYPGTDQRYNAQELYPQYYPITDYGTTKSNIEFLFTSMLTGDEVPQIPKINENDFLYVWTMGHGGGSNGNSKLFLMDGEEITDDELADLINPLPADKKVIWMQQGKSGGFADEFNSDNTIFHSACQPNENAHRANNTPYLENEPWGGIPYHHGEFNFHTYSPTYGASPGYDPEYDGVPYINADVNNDNVVSLEESVSWEATYANGLETSVFSDPGNLAFETSLEYPTIINDNIVTDKTYNGNIGITRPVHVTAGATLTFTGAYVYLDHEGELIIDEGGMLVIQNDVTNETQIVGIYEERQIIINGNIQINEGVHFTSFLTFDPLKIIINNTSLDLTFNYI